MGKRTSDYLTLSEFPNSIDEPFLITSQPDDKYNCVAWVLGITEVWYEPDEDYSIAGVVAFFERYGFKICTNAEAEVGYEKIALFSQDKEEFMHVTKYLEENIWTSKLGFSHDVSHTLESMQGGLYGNVCVFMKKVKL